MHQSRWKASNVQLDLDRFFHNTFFYMNFFNIHIGYYRISDFANLDQSVNKLVANFRTEDPWILES